MAEAGAWRVATTGWAGVRDEGQVMLRGWAALGHTFAARTPVAELDEYLAALFSDLPAAEGSVAHEYRLEGPDEDERWVARLDGDLIEEAGDRARALALLLWRINRGVIEDTDDLVLLHSGGVVVDGRAVLIAGDMEVGKTTLVAGILRAGAGYLSDEAVGLAFGDDDVRGYAKPLSLDPGSWPLFPELEPTVPGPVLAFLPHQWQVRASSLPGVDVVRRAPPAAVVLPRFRPGAPLELERLPGADALLRLSSCVFPTSIDRRRIVERLARLLSRARCYELTYSDLEAGVDVVTELVHAEPRAAHPAGRRTAPVAWRPGPRADLPGSPPGPRVDERRCLARRPDAAVIEVADERVIHVAGSDELHRLDLLGASIWERLDGESTLGELIDEIAAASAQDRDAIAAALVPFVDDLLALELVH